MKAIFNSWLALAALSASLCNAPAADKTHLGGPNGGRFLERTDPRAEFLVGKDHLVTIRFYDAASKPVPATTQTVTVIAETKDGKSTVRFEKQGEVLISQSKLPAGDGYNLVVLFRQTPEAKSQNHRFKLELHPCGGCHRAEYACTCDE